MPERSDKELPLTFTHQSNGKGSLVNRVLVDGGATVNLVPESMLGKLGKRSKDLIYTNVTMINFNGKNSAIKGVVLLNVKVGSINRSTMFIVVPSKTSYNLSLGRDWIHGISAIPATLHQRMILWNKYNEIEEIGSNDSNYYYEQ